MDPAVYDAWYENPRGAWVGATELRIVESELCLRAGARVLDVGCGSGWFTRHLARRTGIDVTGIDIDARSLNYARQRDACSRYVQADAPDLPFADDCFDAVFSIAALCFTDNWPKAVAEVVRVCRGRFAIGMLNRHSLLWRDKGRRGGSGAYRGARWVGAADMRDALAGLPVANLRTRCAVFFPSGAALARLAERCVPAALPYGALLLVSGEKSPVP